MDVDNGTDIGNDTYEEMFLYEIDLSIEYGDCNILLTAIKQYKNLISEQYIEMAYKIYHDLVTEKLEEIII